MEDKEIIKALECCSNADEDCENCILNEFCDKHSFELIKGVYDLINRQKAEIERLKYNLKAVLDEKSDHSEAIKEFAERLKGALSLNVRISNEDYVDIAEDIDNLVKEFKEGSKR